MTLERPRYKFCVDENLPDHLASHLSKLYKRHQFIPVSTLKLKGLDDFALFSRLSSGSFHALITTDFSQLDVIDTSERDALRSAGLHW